MIPDIILASRVIEKPEENAFAWHRSRTGHSKRMCRRRQRPSPGSGHRSGLKAIEKIEEMFQKDKEHTMMDIINHEARLRRKEELLKLLSREFEARKNARGSP